MKDHKKIQTLFVAAALVASTATFSSCSKAAEKVTEKSIEHSTGAKIDTKDGGVSVKTKDGEYSTKATTKLPDGWPKDILPVPSGFNVTNASTTKTPQGSVVVVTLKGKGDVSALADKFETAFKNNGVQVALKTTSGEQGMVTGKKGEDAYQVMFSTSDGEITINLDVTTNS